MILLNIELEKFNLHELHDATDHDFFADVKPNGISGSYIGMEYPKDTIIDELKSGTRFFYSFGIRHEDQLECANGKEYLIYDEDNEDDDAIDMGDAHIDEDDCLNLGYLASYDKGMLKIEVAVEGQSTMFNKCYVVNDCGDLEDNMMEFLQQFIIK